MQEEYVLGEWDEFDVLEQQVFKTLYVNIPVDPSADGVVNNMFTMVTERAVVPVTNAGLLALFGAGSQIGAPNKGGPPQPTWRESFRQTAHYLCGKSASDKVASSVAEGFATGLVEGGVEGFVAGEVFGGEVSFGTTGLAGAYLGAHVGGALGGANGLGLGAIYAGVCYAGGMYDKP